MADISVMPFAVAVRPSDRYKSQRERGSEGAREGEREGGGREEEKTNQSKHGCESPRNASLGPPSMFARLECLCETERVRQT